MVKRLAVYIRPYEKWALLAPVLVVLEVICEIIMPRLMASIVDVGIANGDMGHILRMGLSLIHI